MDKTVPFPNGYTNEELGDSIGCSHSMASRIVSGKRMPSVDLIEKIGVVYGIPINTLLAARRKGVEAFGELMQVKIVRPAKAREKRAAKAAAKAGA
jgi:transcriptional regulator with XRE-family HTH domain